MNYYELFAAEAPAQTESAENVRIRTLRKIEQTKQGRLPTRPLRRVLIAAAAAILLIGGVFAAPVIWNALNAVDTKLASNSVLLHTETGVLAREGYLEITPELTPNENAPKTIETYYIPQLCENWDPITLYYTTEEAPTMQKDAFFAWRLPDGGYVQLRQHPLADYNAESPLDTVSLGFGSDYTLSERQFGEILAQCIAVPPSDCAEPMDWSGDSKYFLPPGYGAYSAGVLLLGDADGTCENMDESTGLSNMHHPGLQKLWWSDGDYLFLLQVNYNMSEETLTEILESFVPVEDFRPYVTLEYTEPVAQEVLPVETPLFPTAVPEGWMLKSTNSQPVDVYTWVWSYEDRSGLELIQQSSPDSYDIAMMDWYGSTEAVTRFEASAQNWSITAFESAYKAALLWKSDTDWFILSSSGPDRLDAPALLTIAESLAPVE